MPAENVGQGQSVAVMGSGDSSTTVKDLALFEQETKLPQVPVKVTDIPKDGDFSDTSGNVEWELDTQASTGMAPGVKQVHLYFAQHLVDPDAEADFANWVDDQNGPKQANASFGECETTPANATLESTIPTQFNNNQDQNALYGTGAPNALEPVADQTLRQGVLEGRTLFAATGDTGSSCPVLVLGPELGAGNGVANQGVPIVNYPAASPYVVAVGGTVLYPDADNTRGARVPVALHRRRPELLHPGAELPVRRERHQPPVPLRRERQPQHRRRRPAAGSRTSPTSPATSPPAPMTSTPMSWAAPPARAAPACPPR